jgi:hypothetical protein
MPLIDNLESNLSLRTLESAMQDSGRTIPPLAEQPDDPQLTGWLTSTLPNTCLLLIGSLRPSSNDS